MSAVHDISHCDGHCTLLQSAAHSNENARLWCSCQGQYYCRYNLCCRLFVFQCPPTAVFILKPALC